MKQPPLAPISTVDLVIPLLNEEDALQAFHQQLLYIINPLPFVFTILYVNDGSTDRTADRLAQIAAADGRVQVLEMSRNFGHQAALTAGMDRSTADYLITLDGDGQHPPEMIPEMLRLAQSGYDLVLTQRVDTDASSGFKRWTSSAFYHVLNRLGDTNVLPSGADFRLLSRPVVHALLSMQEYHRFLRGMVAWVGFRSIILPFQPPERLAGVSKYSLRKMLRLSMDAIFSFSLIPLYAGLSLGGIFFILAIVEAIYVLSFWISGNTSQLAPGWSSLMFMLLIVGGLLMVLMGFIGVYIGYIFQEVKRRPVYILRPPIPVVKPQDSRPQEGHDRLVE